MGDSGSISGPVGNEESPINFEQRTHQVGPWEAPGGIMAVRNLCSARLHRGQPCTEMEAAPSPGLFLVLPACGVHKPHGPRPPCLIAGGKLEGVWELPCLVRKQRKR